MLQMPRVGQQCGQRTCQHGSLLWTASTTFGEQRRSNSNARDAFQKTSNLLFKREPRALPKFRYWRRRIANRWANQYQPGRVEVMGPDFACMEWLMNAGATSVLLSDGTTIGCRKEMSQFLASQGFNLNKLDLEAPETLLLNRTWQEQRLAQSALKSDVAYAERWRHISPIHIKEIDATDAALTDRGFQYFLQCRDIEKLKLNFCDYFGDDALDVLAQGRAVKSLKHLEICFNTWITERAVIKNLTRFRSLQRLHLYFLPMVATKRTAVLRQLKAALPRCKVTFPEVYFISMGYETEEEILVHKRFMKQQRNFYLRWMESEEWMPSIRRKDNDI